MPIRNISYIALLFTFIFVNVAQAQYFDEKKVVHGEDVPCSAFLYKHSAKIVTEAAQNVFKKYNVSAYHSENRDYFKFSGGLLGLVLMNKTTVRYWVEGLSEEKSVLYLSAFKGNSFDYAPTLKYAVVTEKIREELNAVEVECVDISNHLFLSEQYLKVYKLTDELQILYNDLTRLELYAPNSTAQINQIKSAIRLKKTTLNQETDILNRFKESIENM